MIFELNIYITYNNAILSIIKKNKAPNVFYNYLFLYCILIPFWIFIYLCCKRERESNSVADPITIRKNSFKYKD